jgi:hypothetical protein
VAVTVDLYDHTTQKIQAGTFPASDTYIVMLYTTLPFNATATTKTAAESGATQLSTANGYTQNTKALTGVSIATATTNDSRFTFDPVNWDATGSGIAAGFALVYSDTQTNDPPLARINFDGTVTAAAGTQFRITPNAGGFIALTNAA